MTQINVNYNKNDNIAILENPTHNFVERERTHHGIKAEMNRWMTYK